MLLETSHNTPNSPHGRESSGPKCQQGRKEQSPGLNAGSRPPKPTLCLLQTLLRAPPPQTDLSCVPQTMGFRCLLP